MRARSVAFGSTAIRPFDIGRYLPTVGVLTDVSAADLFLIARSFKDCDTASINRVQVASVQV